MSREARLETFEGRKWTPDVGRRTDAWQAVGPAGTVGTISLRRANRAFDPTAQTLMVPVMHKISIASRAKQRRSNFKEGIDTEDRIWRARTNWVGPDLGEKS